MLSQNTQPGFVLTQMSPIDATLPDEFHEVSRDEQLCETDRNLRQIYVLNFLAFASKKPSTYDK